MESLKEFGRAVIALVFGFLMYSQWNLFRPNDPGYVSILVGVTVTVVVFALLHLMGKEE